MTQIDQPLIAIEQRYPPSARARFAQYVLGTIALLSTMDIGVVALLLEPIKHDLGLSDMQAGLANATSYAAAYGLLSVPMGMLVDRVNRVRLVFLAMLVWCASLGLAAAAVGFWSLAVAKAIMGLAIAALVPAALSLYGDYFPPDRRASATATFPLGQILGSAAALLIGGFGFDALTRLHGVDPQALSGLAPWRAIFVLAALIAIPVACLVLLMREPLRMERESGRGGSWRQLWELRTFLLPLLASVVFLSGLSTSVATWSAPALMRLYGQQPGQFAGWLAAVTLVSGIVGVTSSGRLVEQARRHGGYTAVMRPAAIGALLCAPASFMAIAPGIALFAAGMTLFQLSAAVAIVVPVIAINFRVPNELRGRTFGLYVIAGAVGGGLAAPAVASLSQVLGGEAMLGRAIAGVGVPMALLASACLAWTMRSTNPTAAACVSEGIQ